MLKTCRSLRRWVSVGYRSAYSTMSLKDTNSGVFRLIDVVENADTFESSVVNHASTLKLLNNGEEILSKRIDEVKNLQDLLQVVRIIVAAYPSSKQLWVRINNQVKILVADPTKNILQKYELLFLVSKYSLLKDGSIEAKFEEIRGEEQKLDIITRMELGLKYITSLEEGIEYSRNLNTFSKEIVNEIKETGIEGLLRILACISNLREDDKKLFQHALPCIERRIYELETELVHPSMLIDIMEGISILNYQSDSLWKLLTDVIVANSRSLSEFEKERVIRSMSRAQRGNDELWDKWIYDVMKDIGKEKETRIDRLSMLVRCVIENRLELLENRYKSMLTSQHLSKLIGAHGEELKKYLTSAACEDMIYITRNDASLAEMDYLTIETFALEHESSGIHLANISNMLNIKKF